MFALCHRHPRQLCEKSKRTTEQLEPKVNDEPERYLEEAPVAPEALTQGPPASPKEDYDEPF